MLYSPAVITGLPFGRKSIKVGSEKIDIPNVLRLLKNSEIIRVYKKKLENEQKIGMLMSDSTMARILDRCTASRTQSMTCVDYFLAAGNEV